MDLTDIGESLIAEMFNRSERVRGLLLSRVGERGSFLAEARACPEVQLCNCGHYRFDGAHKVDVALLHRDRGICVPCEAKLGQDRLSASAFDGRFLQPCGTSHKDSRIAGSMIAILEGRLPETCCDRPVVVRHEGVEYTLTPLWFLIVRRRVIESWGRKSPVSQNCLTVPMEDIVEAYGGAARFNELVTELITKDYYREWFR